MQVRVLLIAILLLTLHSTSSQSFNPMDFVFSLYISSNLLYHIPSLTQCVFDIKLAQPHIDTLIQGLIKGWQDQSPKEIAGSLGDFVTFFDQSLVACGDAALDTRNVTRKAIADLNNMTFMEEAVQRVGAVLPTILQDVDDTVNGFKTGNATQAGNALGELLRIFFNINKSYAGFSEIAPKAVSFLRKAGLSSIDWPFTNCGKDSDLLQFNQVNLDSQPSKGTPEGINILGTANDQVSTKQVEIKTLLNGNVLNTQTSAFANTFEGGDDVNFVFKVTIPSFAPSGAYSVSMNFQDNNGGSVGCVNVAFNL